MSVSASRAQWRGAFELNGKPFRVASAATAGASFSSARLIVTARFIVVRSGTLECCFSSVGMVTEERTSCCVSHRATAITSLQRDAVPLH
jgi:hypothetical protein